MLLVMDTKDAIAQAVAQALAQDRSERTSARNDSVRRVLVAVGIALVFIILYRVTLYN